MFNYFSSLFLILLFSSCSMLGPTRNNYKITRNYDQNTQKQQSLFMRKKVALLPLFNEAPVGREDLAITATEELRQELSKLRDYAIEPSGQMIFGSSKLIYASSGAKLNEFARKAKLSGVNLVIYGRIVDARLKQRQDEVGVVRKFNSFADVVLEIRVYDVLARKEIYASKMSAGVNDSNYEFFINERDKNLSYRQDILRYTAKVAARKFIPELHKVGSKLEWTGRVAKIIGNNIYINAGRASGLNIGDILKVVTEGEEVYDPESGALVGISKGEVKGTLEILDFFGPDGSVTILNSGGTVTEGDFVQLY